MIRTGATLFLLAPLAAWGYSFVPLAVEDVADLSACVVEARVVSGEAKRAGGAIVTDHLIDVMRKAGDCGAIGATATVRTPGGMLPDGESLRIEGYEPLAPGGPWVLFVAPGRDGALELVAGPQGAIRITTREGGNAAATDALGNSIVSLRDDKRGVTRLGRRAPGIAERWREGVNAAAKGRALPRDQLGRDEVYTAAAARLQAKSPAQRKAARDVVLEKLQGERPGFISTGEGWVRVPALQAAAPREPAIRTVALGADGVSVQSVQVDRRGQPEAAPCAARPTAPGEPLPAGCEVRGEKYAFTGFGDRTWNPFPESFGGWYRQDQGVMAEWNRYADHFRVLTTPTGTFGLNGYNDVGGWPASDVLASIYGSGWAAGTLGIAFTRTWCSEITREYFLGILIREYCSGYTTDSDIFLNPASTWTLDDVGVRMGTNSGWSMREVMLHELGHGFGLGHSNQTAVMRSCSTRLGWRPYTDDVAGARARWPGKAKYGASLNVRLVYGYGSGACSNADTIGPWMSSSYASTDGANVTVGPFLLENFDSVARAGAEVEWYLARNPIDFSPGTYVYLGTTPHGTVAPGATLVESVTLPLPSTSFGRGYLTAYVRAGAGAANADSAPSPLYSCVGTPGMGFIHAGTPAQAYLGPVDCNENVRSFLLEGLAGQPERIDLASPQFDTLMRLFGPDGIELAMNDDFGGTLNSRIEIVLPADGTYRVEVTSYGGSSTGAFTLARALAEADDDGDGLPNGDEVLEGRNGTFKDNDLFSPGVASARLFAMQQYRDFLGRRGDAAGIQGWGDAVAGGSWTRNQVIDAFVTSAEFGGFVAPVVRLYFGTFLRVPDYDGLVANAAVVRNGTVTLAQLADFFASSPEFIATYGALDNAAFVRLLYNNVLARAPDPAGLAGWASLLDGGMSRGQVLLGFSESAEYQAAMANEVLVTMMYTAMLRRSPEPAGFNGWVQFLDDAVLTREQVISGFFLSSEYRARFLP